SHVSKIYEPKFELNTACSPHHSAELDQRKIALTDFAIPACKETLIIEGAGGLYVPLNENDFIIDLIAYLKLPVILVCQDYLGCINHSILSINALKQRNIQLSHLVFNGEFQPSSKRIILANLHQQTQVIEIPW